MPEKMTKQSKRSGPSAFGKLYLLTYNSIQTLGWSYLLFKSLIYFLNRGTLDDFWQEIKWLVIIFQGGAILEVLHSLLGLVSSGFMVVVLQVYSRVFLVFGILLNAVSATVSPGLPICVLAWCITEIVRYSFYGLNLIDSVPPNLKFARYSTFLVLYPLGVTGELLCMYHALDEIAAKNWNAYLPNQWNFIFDYYYFIIIYMFMYIPFFPFLYVHMLSQRRKALSDDKKKAK